MGDQTKVYSYLSPSDLCDRLQRSWLGINSGKQMCGGKTDKKKKKHGVTCDCFASTKSFFIPHIEGRQSSRGLQLL